MEKTAKRKGRPPSANPRTKRIEARFTPKVYDQLCWCMTKTGKTKTELLDALVSSLYKHLGGK